MRNTIYFILIALLFSACASGKKESPQNKAEKPDFLNDFIIVAYSSPPPEETTLERYKEMAESGIEYLATGGHGDYYAEQNLKAMDYAYEVGIGMIPWDIRTVSYTANQEISIDTSGLRGIIEDYKNHPALVGYQIMDEPYAHLFPELDTIFQFFRKADPDHEPIVNVNPSYGWVGDDYGEYVRNYIKTVNPGLFSYDHYVFRYDTVITEPWFDDLALVREETRKAGIPYIVFIFCEGIKPSMKLPNRAEILWQVNTALAYGTRGIGWFTYWTPLHDHGWSVVNPAKTLGQESHYNAMIDKNGNRTEMYDYAKETNQYLKKVGKNLLGWDNPNVARFEAETLINGSSPVVTPEGDNANLVIGTFKKDKKVRVVISNSKMDQSTEFSLQVSPDWKIDDVFASIDAESTNNELTGWTLKPGGSVVIELK